LQNSALTSGYEEASSGQSFHAAPVDDATGGTSAESGQQHFHWARALTESFTFLVIEQAYVVHTGFRWVVSKMEYRSILIGAITSSRSPSGLARNGTTASPNWFGYVGRPIQGALTGFIQIQNDPKSQKLEFSRTKAYWKSRLKAALWNAVYSTRWNLGKYGSQDRAPWNSNGSFPCNTNHCYTGVGQSDVVMTPLGGTGWLIGEDFLEKQGCAPCRAGHAEPFSD